MMRSIYMFIFLLLSVSVWGQDMQVEDKSEIIQQAVDAVVADPSFAQAIVGICVMDSEGNVLAGSNQEKMLIPASNMKLFSTGAALHVLGPEYCFETTVAHDGVIEDGVLKGNLFVIGGGDPTLGSKDSIAVPLERTFAVWEKLLRDAGVRRIEGSIVGDGRYFEGPAEEPTWLWNDIGTYYGAGVTGLMFYENMQSFSVSAGPSVGAPVNIRPHYPECPWMDFRYACSTGTAGTGDLLYMYTSDLAPVAEIRGTFAVDRAAKRVDCANKFPEYTCAHYFAEYLRRKGIPCSEGAGDFRLKTDWMPETEPGGMTVLGSSFSPSLDRIVFETNHASNNVFAETLFRSLGKVLHSSACYDSSYVAINDAFTELGLAEMKGIRIQDGSGLSRQNLVSAEALCRFLYTMGDSPAFEYFLESLPSPGFTGTLEYNMKGQPESLRSRIKVKSGSMTGVRCYSGYILPTGSAVGGHEDSDGLPDGALIISIMTNNCTSPTWKVRPLLDRLMVALAKTN
jgi:D-alanyl-D-alanine carboxypeptidase/D-alanyl-D-alanine-endopeptidase (penicillin-binding protein 4)